MEKTFEKCSISRALSSSLIEAAMEKAKELEMRIAVTIVDESGIMKAFSRMDGAVPMATGASQKKAVTAVGFGLSTGDAWYEFIKDDPILNKGVQGIQDFMLLGGGSPIIVDGIVAGAIGVSGGHYKQDEECAAAALEILTR